MSGEAWAALVGAVGGAGLTYMATTHQRAVQDKRKLKATASLLLMEFWNLQIKLELLTPPFLARSLSLDVWQSVRTDMAGLLKDELLFETMCTVAFVVEEWNAVAVSGMPVSEMQDWHELLSDLVADVIPQLQSLSSMRSVRIDTRHRADAGVDRRVDNV